MQTLFAKIIGLAGILHILLPLVMSVDSSCDFKKNLDIGESYSVKNEKYPDDYPPGAGCRWTVTSPEGSILNLTCAEVNLPSSDNRQDDAFTVSPTGDPDLQDGNKYCGKTTVELYSEGNSITIGLSSSSKSSGGKFSCTVRARNNTCDCGWQQTTKIVGGQNTSPNEYPFMASIATKNSEGKYNHSCGASIITRLHALTAAHCTIDMDRKRMQLLVGEWDLSVDDDTNSAARYGIAKVFDNLFDDDEFHGDIAILKTDKAIEFSVDVGPICLPFRYTGMNFVNETVTAMGWGRVSYSGRASDILKEVNLSVVPQSACLDFYTVTAKQICTYKDRKDACQGDSGGPMVWQDPKTQKWMLVAIISYGDRCAVKGHTGVNTRVTAYLDWIVEKLGADDELCIK